MKKLSYQIADTMQNIRRLENQLKKAKTYENTLRRRLLIQKEDYINKMSNTKKKNHLLKENKKKTYKYNKVFHYQRICSLCKKTFTADNGNRYYCFSCMPKKETINGDGKK